MPTGYAAVNLEAVASTQDEARARFAGTPLLVTARQQEAGRGRFGRVWLNAPRALAASLAVRPHWEASSWGRIALVAGLAAANVLETESGLPIMLKWPNDLMDRQGAKLGGLLGEIDEEVVVIGLGVNLYWPAPPVGVGALWEADPGREMPIRLAGQWAGELLKRMEASPTDWGRDEYKRRCWWLGQEVGWEPDQRGIAIDISPGGELVVDQSGFHRWLISGEVRTLRSIDGQGQAG